MLFRSLVTNRPTLAVVAERSTKDDEQVLVALAGVLGMPLEEIRERVSSVKEAALRPRIVAIDVSPEVVAYLAEHEAEFPGVEIQVVPIREYPNGDVAAHVLGYTGEISEKQLAESDFSTYALGDTVGKSGAERQFESVLQGDKGYRRVEVDATGRPRAVIEEIGPVPGRDVVLTLDLEVQRVTEEALERALAEARKDDFVNARAAAAVALDIRTGEVLAMASLPTYDPTVFLGGISMANWKRLNAKGSEYPLNNRAIMGLYPPASTFKIMTGLAGLSHGVTSEWKTYYCEGRWTEMGEQWPKFCWNRRGHGTISFHNGMIKSCNTVFYEIGYAFYKRKDEKLQEYARQWGFGQRIGIDLPGEVEGRIPDAKWKAALNKDYPEFRTWLPGEAVDLAIGQGDVLVTPLQITAAYAGIANGGVVMRPHVLDHVLDSKGQPILEFQPEASFEPEVSDRDLDIIKRMLVGVTKDGTGTSAFRGFPVAVAGKTGTAQVATKDNHAWFAAFAPADDPRYAVAVVVEQGGGGGAIAAPAAREILSALLGLPIERVTATDESR